MDVNEAKRLKELERKNRELKKMLAEALLKNPSWRWYAKKNSEPGLPPGVCQASSGEEVVFKAGGMSVFAGSPFELQLPMARPQ